MRPITVTLSDLDDDTNGICESQSPASAGDLDLDGVLVADGVATLAAAQIITITSDGDDSGVDFVVYGKDANGWTISELVAGPNATTAKTTSYFKTVTRVSISGTATGNIIVGVVANDGAVSQTIVTNINAQDFKAALGLVISGTLNATVQHSFNNPFDTAQDDSTWFATDGLSSKTGSDDGNYDFPVFATRLKLNSYTTGSASYTYIQAG